MIERYTRPAMGRIWTLENRYRAWLAVEVAVCEAWAELGRVPAEAVKTIREKADIDVDRILEIEQTTRHDVIAFLTSLEEKVGPDARYIHLGCTSSDIVDTANGYLFMQAGKLIVEDIEKVLASLEALARKHKGVLCMGRTHGIHAEPTSFGLKMTGFHAEFQRHLERVKAGIESVRVGKISGAVGTYAFLSPELEEKALTADSKTTFRAQATGMDTTDTEGNSSGSIAMNAKNIKVASINVDKEKRTDKEMAKDSQMVLLSDKMFIGKTDKDNASQLVQVGSDKVAVFATTTAELQQGEAKAVVTLDGGNVALGGDKVELKGDTTIGGKADIKGETKAPAGKFDNLEAGSAFKSPNISDGMGVGGGGAAEKPSAKLKEEEVKKEE